MCMQNHFMSAATAVAANVIKYWRKFLDNDNAGILAYFAVKLFDITVHSERTASTITWLNSTLCNSQKSSSLVVKQDANTRTDVLIFGG